MKYNKGDKVMCMHDTPPLEYGRIYVIDKDYGGVLRLLEHPECTFDGSRFLLEERTKEKK